MLGFPVALVLSWAFDWSLEGLKRTDDDDDASNLASSIHVDLPRSATERRRGAFEKHRRPAFDNLRSDDKEIDYFAAGIHDDILSNLAKVADLKELQSAALPCSSTKAADEVSATSEWRSALRISSREPHGGPAIAFASTHSLSTREPIHTSGAKALTANQRISSPCKAN